MNLIKSITIILAIAGTSCVLGQQNLEGGKNEFNAGLDSLPRVKRDRIGSEKSNASVKAQKSMIEMVYDAYGIEQTTLKNFKRVKRCRINDCEKPKVQNEAKKPMNDVVNEAYGTDQTTASPFVRAKRNLSIREAKVKRNNEIKNYGSETVIKNGNDPTNNDKKSSKNLQQLATERINRIDDELETFKQNEETSERSNEIKSEGKLRINPSKLESLRKTQTESYIDVLKAGANPITRDKRDTANILIASEVSDDLKIEEKPYLFLICIIFTLLLFFVGIVLIYRKASQKSRQIIEIELQEIKVYGGELIESV